MRSVIAKTFGGLSARYYIRQFLFGLIFTTLMISTLTLGDQQQSPPFSIYAIIAANTFLYPYSRFVYESIVEYITGGNLFFFSAVLVLIVKLMTMALCWSFAIFIAPIGLIYLYIHHSRGSAV
ncbi:hypothetical protein [Terrihabitans sp. B22-R8]|uniref:hypothetical protein n=1 Tax=Terrihabitans sp. B22-R8 TaxID=3425128 RepID=UPI00403C153D